MARTPTTEQAGFAMLLHNVAANQPYHERLAAMRREIAARDERRSRAWRIVLGLAVVSSLAFGVVAGSCAPAFGATASFAGLRGAEGWPVFVDGVLDTVALRGLGAHELTIQYPDNAPNKVLYALYAKYPKCQRIAKVTLETGWPGHGPTKIAEAMGGLVNPNKVNIAAPGMVDAMVAYIASLRAQRIYAPSGQRLPFPAWQGVHLEVCRDGDSTWIAAWDELVTRIREESPGWSLWLNCGVPEYRTGWSWMLENFPFQGGQRGDIFGGYRLLLEGRLGTRPLLFVAASLDTGLHRRQYDYGWACAYAYGGVLIFEPKEPIDGTPWWRWEMPRYDLGKPLWPAKPWPGGHYVSAGERGYVVIDPTYPSNQGSPSYRGRAFIVQSEGGAP